MMLRTSLGRAALALFAGLALASSALAQTGTIGRAPATGGLPGTYAVGDLLCASSTSALGRLAAPAVGQVLKSNGVGVCPSWSGAPSLASLALGGATIGTDLIGAQGSYAKARVSSTGALVVQGASVNDLLTFGGTASGTISYASNTLGTHYQFVGDRSGSGGGADLRLGSTALIAFNVNPALNTGALDAGLSRISAGVIGVGTGAQGSVAGGLQAATLALAGASGAGSTYPLVITGGMQISTYYNWANGNLIGATANGTTVFQTSSGSGGFKLTASNTDGTIQHGAADAASPVAQTIKFQDVVAGTSNTAGVNATFQAPAGTGTGAGGSLIFQVAPAGGAGSAKNAWATALTIDSTKVASFGGSINVAGGEGLTTTGRGGIIQAADGVFRVYNQANSSTFSITAGASNLATFNGPITAGGAISTSTGNVTSANALVAAASGSVLFTGRSMITAPSVGWFRLSNAGATETVDITLSGGSTTGLGTAIFAGPVKTLTTTVSALPAAGTAGRRAFVTDANASTFGTTAAGGGSNNVPVYDTGAAWVIGANDNAANLYILAA